MDRLQRKPHLRTDLGYLLAGVSRVPAAVVEEVADIVRLENLDQSLVFRTIFIDAFELVAAGAERT